MRQYGLKLRDFADQVLFLLRQGRNPAALLVVLNLPRHALGRLFAHSPMIYSVFRLVGHYRVIVPLAYLPSMVYVGWEIFERDVYRLSRIKQGDVIIDVGAHIGLFTLVAAAKIGPEGRIIAVEPNPLSQRLLKANIALNGLRNVTVIEAALGVADTCGRLYGFKWQSTTDSLLERSATVLSSRVRIRKLDSILLSVQSLTHIDLLKIDVEGTELNVLAGASNSLQHVRRVIIEVHEMSVMRSEVIRFLANHGFAIQSVSTHPGLESNCFIHAVRGEAE